MKTGKDKLIKVLAAVLIVTGSVLTLGVKFYADDAALSVDRPTFIKSAPGNNISILVGNTIYLVDENGFTINVIDFDELGLKVTGDHDYFNNGDLLLYSSHTEPGLLDNLARFARFKETRNESVSGTDGLYRCDVQTKDCQLFTTALAAMYPPFRVDVDRNNDTVYFSDTPRFALYKLDSDGNLLAKNAKNFWFPNQLYLYEDNLYIADTNHHVIKVVQSNTEHFGEEVESHQAVIGGQHQWPTEVIKTPEHWWVGISDNSMDNGRIQLFDNNWKKSGSALLVGSDGDAKSMELFADEVWVTDWTKIKIYRFNLAGERLSDFSNNEIERAFANSHRLIKQNETLSSYGLTAFFVVFSLGLLAAYLIEKEATVNAFKLREKVLDTDIGSVEALTNPEGEGVYWIETKSSKYRTLISILFAALLIFLIGSLVIILTNEDTMNWQLNFTFISIVPLFILIYWAWYRATKIKIGISGQLLLVDDGNGNVGIGKGALVRHNNRVLIIDNTIAFLGQPHTPLYPKEKLIKWVIPRMQLGETVGQGYILKTLWQQKHPTVIVAIGLLIYIIMVMTFTAS